MPGRGRKGPMLYYVPKYLCEDFQISVSSLP